MRDIREPAIARWASVFAVELGPTNAAAGMARSLRQTRDCDPPRRVLR